MSCVLGLLMLTIVPGTLIQVVTGKDVQYQGVCDPQDVCLTPGAVCDAASDCQLGHCRCPQGWVYSVNRCIKQLKLAETCDSKGVCPSDASCSGGKCVCKDSAHVVASNGWSCHPKVLQDLGADCTSQGVTGCKGHWLAFGPHTNGLECTTKAGGGGKSCSCKAGYSAAGTAACAPRAVEEYRGLCHGKTTGAACGISYMRTACSSPSSGAALKCLCRDLSDAWFPHTLNGAGDLSGKCLGDDADVDVDEGKKCNTAQAGLGGLYCKKGLYCHSCPEDNNVWKCHKAGLKNGSAGVKYSCLFAFAVIIANIIL